nr:transporter substrate-binding domain-containing protein [Sneathiella limimaris]
MCISPASAAEVQCTEGETITLAAEDSFFPYSGLHNGKQRGFSFDIVRAAYAAVGCQLNLLYVPYNRCMEKVENGTFLGCFNTTNSYENSRKYILHNKPLLYGKILIYARKGHPKEFDQSSYHNARFAVVRGYTYTDEFDQDEKIKKVFVDSDLQTLAMVARGRADYALVYEKVAKYQMADHRELIKQLPEPVSLHATYGLYVSFSRALGEKAERAAKLLDTGLSHITVNGTYEDIEKAWTRWLDTGLADGDQPPLYQVGG